MGNRGVIHNEAKEITHAFKTKAWITCVLQFKGRHRAVMTPNRWTELFFLDEATAFAAGHRPCFECRRGDAIRFKACWIAGNPAFRFSMKTFISEIDKVIHEERIDHDKNKVSHQRLSSSLPEGVFVAVDGEPYVLTRRALAKWTPLGYTEEIVLPDAGLLTVLTPTSIVNAFNAGYKPQIGA